MGKHSGPFRTRQRAGQVEIEVWRTPDGRYGQAPRGQRREAELRAEARRQRDLNDRTGKRLRWGGETDGWWYMVKGPRYWIRQGTKPAFHYGYYYVPGQTWPVVPPKDTWERWNSYHGIPGRSVLARTVPADIWEAAHMQPEDRVGRRPRGDTTPLREKFLRALNRAGVGPDVRNPSKRVKTRKVTKKKG